MERLTVTTIGKLLIGDRFYKKNDPHKIVLTKMDVEIGKNFAKNDNEKFPKKYHADTEVIFLRHQNTEL